MQQQIQQFSEVLKNSQKILLINHIRMDGDAWGSLGGLFLVLKNMGKDVRCINDDSVPESLDFLGYSDIIEPELDVKNFDPDICISLDAASTERLGQSYEKWKQVFDEKTLIVIDHHISNPGFGDINIIDTSASSTCELLVHILHTIKLEKYITPEAATFLYTGIQTDTNMYATSNTTQNTLLAGAKLIKLGADFRLPIQKCFREKSKEQLQVWKLAYQNTQISKDGNISYCTIRPQDIETNGIDPDFFSEHLKGFINETLINIQGVKIAFLLYPLKNGNIKGSMRCVDGYDVNSICQQFGGGGHIQAAGFESKDSIAIVEKKLLSLIKKAC